MGPLLLPALCGHGGCGLQAALSRPASPLCSRPACSTVGGGRPLPPAPPPLPAAAPDAAWMPRGCHVDAAWMPCACQVIFVLPGGQLTVVSLFLLHRNKLRAGPSTMVSTSLLVG